MHIVCKIYAWKRLYKLSWIASLDCGHLCRTVVNVGIMWGPWIASELLSSKHRRFLIPGTSQSPVQSSGTLCTDRSPSFITKCCWVYQTVRNFIVFSPGLSHLRTIYAHTRLTAFCPGLPGWAGTIKVKPIWILLKQEAVSGSGVSWTIIMQVCTSLQTDNHASTPWLSFLQARCPSCCPANIVKALKALRTIYFVLY